jgi:hypothetical protein
VETYSGRILTNPEDNLTAIAALAALAEHYSTYYKDHFGTYLAGHWRNFLHSSLRWCVLKPESAVKVKRAPSWSRAAVNGSIGYRPKSRSPDRVDFEILNCTTNLKDPGQLFGAVKSGMLQMKCRIGEVLWHPGMLSRCEHFHVSETQDSPKFVAKGYPDTFDAEPLTSTKIHLVSVGSEVWAHTGKYCGGHLYSNWSLRMRERVGCFLLLRLQGKQRNNNVGLDDWNYLPAGTHVSHTLAITVYFHRISAPGPMPLLIARTTTSYIIDIT